MGTNRKVLIVGAGGHGQVVADVLLRAWETGSNREPIGFIDDNPVLHGQNLVGLPVFGGTAQLSDIEHDAVVVAIGNNRTRAEAFSRLNESEQEFVNAVHPSVVIASDVELGRGIVICAGVVINTGAVIGDNVTLNTGSSIDHHNKIGPHTHVAPGVHLGGNVHIGVGAFLGIGCAVVPNCFIGDWAVIGAGASVIRDVPSFATAVGVPARVVKRRKPKSFGYW